MNHLGQKANVSFLARGLLILHRKFIAQDLNEDHILAKNTTVIRSSDQKGLNKIIAIQCINSNENLEIAINSSIAAL